MPKMTAAEAAVRVLESEGVDLVFGIPGAAILPIYEALRRTQIKHVLVRHEEGGAHMAEGYTRAVPGKIGVNIGTSGPAGTDMVTGLYSAMADSIPILCITGQAPRAKLHKEDFQAIDIAAIARPVTKWAVTVLEAAQLPWAFRQAFQIMRSGRPGPVLLDLPLDVQRELIEYNPWFDVPLEVYKPRAQRKQIEHALDMLAEAKAPVIVAGGGVINADASDLLVQLAEITNTPVIPTLMGWGAIPDDHPLMAGMVGLQTQHRYGNLTFLKSDFVLGIGNRWANRHTGSVEVYTKGRKFVHVDIEPMQIGRVFAPDLGIVSDAKAALEVFVEVARERQAAKRLPDRSRWVAECQKRKPTLQRRSNFGNTPIKPQRVFQEINRAFDATTRDSSLRSAWVRSPRASFRRCTGRATTSSAGRPARWAGTSRRRSASSSPIPPRRWSAVGGDYDFQFLIEELAVGAQYKVPVVFVLINNSYLGLIRQAQKGYKMDFEVQLGFDNINSPELGEYGVDHVKAAEGLGLHGRCACSIRRRSRTPSRRRASSPPSCRCRWWSR